MKLLNEIMREADFKAAHPVIAMEDELFHVGEAQRLQLQGALACEELDQIEDLQAALEDLAHVTQGIQAATPREAALYHVATEAIFSVTNLDVSSIVPALEAGEADQGHSSRLAELAKKVFTALKAIFEKVLAFIADFFSHLGKTIGNAHKRLEQARERLNQLRGGKPKSTTIPGIPLQGGNGWCHNEQDIAKSLIHYNAQLTQFARDSSAYLQTVSMSVVKFLGTTDDDEGWKDPARLMDVVNAAAGTRASARNPIHGQEETITVGHNTEMKFFDAEGEPLLGGKVVRFTYVHGFQSPDQETTFLALRAVLTRCRFSIGHVDVHHSHLEEMSAGTAGGCDKLLEILGRTLEHLQSRSASSGGIDTLGGAANVVKGYVQSTGKYLMKEVDTNWTAATAAGKAELDCIWAAGKFYASEAAKPLADLMMNTLRQFNLVLSYVNKSLDNFEAAIDTSVVELKSHPQLAQA